MRTGLPIRRGGRAAPPSAQLLDLSPFTGSTVPLDPVQATTAVVGALFGNPPATRRIGNLQVQPMVTVEEDHEDDLVITEFPVEYGAAITDHSYKRPSEVKIRVGWSQAAGVSRTGPYKVDDVRTVYNDLLALQESRNPFTLVTGKREYINMLVASIRVHTDARFEYSFIADVSLKQILLVSTQTLPASMNVAALANTPSNAPTTPQGDQPLTTSTITDKGLSEAGVIPPNSAHEAGVIPADSGTVA